MTRASLSPLFSGFRLHPGHLVATLLLAGCAADAGDPPGADGVQLGDGAAQSGGDAGLASSGGGTALDGQGSTSGLGAASGGGRTGSGGDGVVTPPSCPSLASRAYEGQPVSLPGTVEAELFDPGSYMDSTDENEGATFRMDESVDVKEMGDGFAVGWMTAGEWLDYTVNVTQAGNFVVEVNAGAVDPGRTLSLSQCGTPLSAAMAVPEVGDWGQVERVTVGPFRLEAGVQAIRVEMGDLDFVDFDSMTFRIDDGSFQGTGGTGNVDVPGSGGSGGEPSVLPKFVGNITTGWPGSVDTEGRVFSDHWDQITPENAGKWGVVQKDAFSEPNWDTLDNIYDYTQKKGIIFKQHAFVWGSQQPSGALSESDVKTWMKTFCERYPETKLIDVVNEPPPHTEPSYANAIGGGTADQSWTWIVNSFKWAHEYCPDAILILNDYNNIEYRDQSDHFIDIAKTVLAAGAPVHALGAQSHALSNGNSTAAMKEMLTKMHTETGLPVYITEYDIDLNDDTAQLNKYKEHFPFFMETEWIHGVTVWGWVYGRTWVDHSGLIRNGNARPAFTWLMEELERPAP